MQNQHPPEFVFIRDNATTDTLIAACEAYHDEHSIPANNKRNLRNALKSFCYDPGKHEVRGPDFDRLGQAIAQNYIHKHDQSMVDFIRDFIASSTPEACYLLYEGIISSERYQNHNIEEESGRFLHACSLLAIAATPHGKEQLQEQELLDSVDKRYKIHLKYEANRFRLKNESLIKMTHAVHHAIFQNTEHMLYTQLNPETNPLIQPFRKGPVYSAGREIHYPSRDETVSDPPQRTPDSQLLDTVELRGHKPNRRNKITPPASSL